MIPGGEVLQRVSKESMVAASKPNQKSSLRASPTRRAHHSRIDDLSAALGRDRNDVADWLINEISADGWGGILGPGPGSCPDTLRQQGGGANGGPRQRIWLPKRRRAGRSQVGGPNVRPYKESSRYVSLRRKRKVTAPRITLRARRSARCHHPRKDAGRTDRGGDPGVAQGKKQPGGGQVAGYGQNSGGTI